MSTASIPSCATGGFFDRFHCIITYSDHILEGTVWAGWFGWTAADWTTAVSNRQQAYDAPPPTVAEKKQKKSGMQIKIFSWRPVLPFPLLQWLLLG